MFKRATWPKVLEDQTFALQPGQWTTPIRTRQGYVILKVTEHTRAGVQPLRAVEQQVQEAIYNEAMQPAFRAYLTELREKAYIDIAPGFVDTGASAEARPSRCSRRDAPARRRRSLRQGAARQQRARCCQALHRQPQLPRRTAQRPRHPPRPHPCKPRLLGEREAEED